MVTFLVIVLIVLCGMVVFSLIRGIAAFLKTTRIDLENDTAETVPEMQLLQNRAMMARIRYQALAILVAVILMAIGR